MASNPRGLNNKWAYLGELNKVSASDCNNDRRQEVAIRPPKQEIFISPKHDRLEIPTLNLTFFGTANSIKVRSGNYDSVGQPEMEIRCFGPDFATSGCVSL